MTRLPRQIRRIVSMVAVIVTVLWGFAGAVVSGHEMTSSPMIMPNAGIAVSAHSGHGVDAVSDSCNESSLDDHGGGFDRCCPPGCAFSAMTPMPSGTIFHAPVAVPGMTPDVTMPTGGAAPPLRPPRVS